jgi:hypothetical protein
MKNIYFKCKLLTDVVLNSSLATEGNMNSLDYIPGSNFLGIVAKQYDDLGKDAFDIFHSGKVSFGDALITKDKALSYTIPYSLFLEKLNNDITKDKVWVHHGIKNQPEENGRKLQLKQHRSGYLNANKKYIPNVEKEFVLKSAYDREERRSAESKMFGFDAIKAGQEFIFSVIFEDEQYIETVTNALIGEKHIGKSKTAQYGRVFIEKMKQQPETFENKPVKDKELIIYAESNLCFLNEYGQPTFQPEAKDFGVNGTILWDKSQIRTYSYSPWNTKRNTSETQRDVILRGSVVVIELKDDVKVENLPRQVGEYNAEGLGRVIYNPEFLEYNENENGVWKFRLEEIIDEVKENKNISIDKLKKTNLQTKLAKFLKDKALDTNKELKIGKKILEILKEDEKNEKILLDNEITNSQWGAIRSYATLAKDVDDLVKKLFDTEEGYLTHGVAYEKIWGKQKDKRIKALKRIIEDNKDLGTDFVAKLASEIAKKNNQNGK